MDERATGIILRTRLLTETSLIAQWLTLEHGRIATVAKGARRAKSPYLGKLDLYYGAEFSFLRSRRSSLHTLREVKLTETRPFLRTEFIALEIAARAGRRIERSTEEDTPLPEVYALFREFLDELARPPLDGVLLIAFEIRLLEILGLAPEREGVGLSIGSQRAMEQIATVDWAASRRVKLAASQAHEINAFLDRAFLVT